MKKNHLLFIFNSKVNGYLRSLKIPRSVLAQEYNWQDQLELEKKLRKAILSWIFLQNNRFFHCNKQYNIPKVKNVHWV